MAHPVFDAFISYRRSDGKHAAHWLRRALETYRVPRVLRDRYGKGLKVYLDTAYERGTSDFYENTIRPALLASRWLLVLATPDARLRPDGAEDWIQREVADFAAGPNGRNVIAVRGAGTFDDPLPADVLARFPRIEIVDLRGASRFSFLNPVRTARLSAEKLKLVASLLDLPHADMPMLRQEEELRQQAKSGGLIGATLGVLSAVSGLSVYALQSHYQATRALEDTLFTTGSMVLSASRQGDQQSFIVTRGCDLIDELSRSSGIEAQISERVVCSLQRAEAREKNGEQDLARSEYDQAIEIALSTHATSKRVEAAEAALKAQQALAEHLVRQGQPQRAEEVLQQTSDTARKLRTDHEKSSQLLIAEGNALERKGQLSAKRGDHVVAREAYDGAAAAVSQSLALIDERDQVGTIRWLVQLHDQAASQRIALADLPGAQAELERALAAIATVDKGKVTPELDHQAAFMHARLYEVEKSGGDSVTARRSLDESLALTERVLATATVTPEQRELTAKLKQWLLEQEAK
jgi:tetratricopeptide (TPR) repeat protein